MVEVAGRNRVGGDLVRVPAGDPLLPSNDFDPDALTSGSFHSRYAVSLMRSMPLNALLTVSSVVVIHRLGNRGSGPSSAAAAFSLPKERPISMTRPARLTTSSEGFGVETILDAWTIDTNQDDGLQSSRVSTARDALGCDPLIAP
jgi:hypothetical protein